MKKVITYGSFDLFHEGHYQLLRRAKELGDYLIVGVTSEEYDLQRGKLSIIDSLENRIQNVKQTGFVDEIIIETHLGQKVDDIQKFGIDIFTVGSDWYSKFDYLSKYCEVIYLERTKNVSSTFLRNKQLTLRLGIIGSGRIANRAIEEIKYVSGYDIVGVFNPNLKSAKGFKEKYDLKIATNNIDNLFQHVDAVYIASPHETHYEYTKRALEANLHVICEKPLTLQYDHSKELIDIANLKKLVLLEGLKTAYSPGFNKIVSLANSQIVGKVQHIDCSFTKISEKSSRELTSPYFGGSVYELGSYVLLPIIKIMGLDYKNINFRSIFDEKTIDVFTILDFQFADGFASAKVGLGVKSDNSLSIYGTEGCIHIKAPWWKPSVIEIRRENHNFNQIIEVPFLGEGLRYEFSEFLSLIRHQKNETYKLSHKESLVITDILGQFTSYKNLEKGRAFYAE